MRPPGQLRKRILAFLKYRMSVTDRQVATFAGIAHQTAYHHLDALCNDGEAHRTRTYNPKGSWLVTFNYGPGSEVSADSFDSRATVKEWEPLAVVDPWMLPRAFFTPTGAHA